MGKFSCSIFSVCLLSCFAFAGNNPQDQPLDVAEAFERVKARVSDMSEQADTALMKVSTLLTFDAANTDDDGLPTIDEVRDYLSSFENFSALVHDDIAALRPMAEDKEKLRETTEDILATAADASRAADQIADAAAQLPYLPDRKGGEILKLAQSAAANVKNAERAAQELFDACMAKPQAVKKEPAKKQTAAKTKKRKQ
ncbi:MAG: hypothetical protein WCS77_07580 [Elusimicrobiaceae bacterium]|jgi:hypothetical protein